MENLTTYMNSKGGDAFYYPASEEEQIKAAFASIIEEISSGLSVGGVTVTDGISTGVTSSSVLVNGDVSGFTYTVGNGANAYYEVTVDENGDPYFKIGSSAPAKGTIKSITYTDPANPTQTKRQTSIVIRRP